MQLPKIYDCIYPKFLSGYLCVFQNIGNSVPAGPLVSGISQKLNLNAIIFAKPAPLPPQVKVRQGGL